MRTDAETQASGRGRNSVRISSKEKIADVRVSSRDLRAALMGIGGVHCRYQSHACRMWHGESTKEVNQEHSLTVVQWPAFWTTTDSGWPVGGEIDIIEGANALPTESAAAWNATVSAGMTTPLAGYPLVQDVASLHTSSACQLPGDTYMTGTIGSTTCDAYISGNTGCGVELGGNTTYGVDSFGSGVNENGGGYYAMWRDLER